MANLEVVYRSQNIRIYFVKNVRPRPEVSKERQCVKNLQRTRDTSPFHWDCIYIYGPFARERPREKKTPRKKKRDKKYHEKLAIGGYIYVTNSALLCFACVYIYRYSVASTVIAYISKSAQYLTYPLNSLAKKKIMSFLCWRSVAR